MFYYTAIFFPVLLKEQLQGLMIVTGYIVFVQLVPLCVIGCVMWLMEFLWSEELCLWLV